MSNQQQTEQRIIDAATQIFYSKGYYGARMQEIADLAGINKAMLHYYFRSKEKLFERVFETAVNQMLPKLLAVLSSQVEFRDKVSKFYEIYIEFLQEHPVVPMFVMHELSHNPDKLPEKIFSKLRFAEINFPNNLIEEINSASSSELNSKQIIINMISWAIFPFLAKPMLKFVLQIDESDFNDMIEERKSLLPNMFLKSIGML